jgi:hypothetical protein
MNVVAWDLTYAGPDTLGGIQISGFAGGVKAPPGEYLVRLTYGTTQERSLNVLPDPRLAGIVGQDEYDEQFRLSIAVRDTISRIYDAIRKIRDVHGQLKAIADRASEADYSEQIKELADSLMATLTGVEEDLRQTKNESGQDMLRYPPKLDTQFLMLYSYVNGVDNYGFGGPEGDRRGRRQRFQLHDRRSGGTGRYPARQGLVLGVVAPAKGRRQRNRIRSTPQQLPGDPIVVAVVARTTPERAVLPIEEDGVHRARGQPPEGQIVAHVR